MTEHHSSLDDEALSALLDGELDEDQAARLRERLTRDEELAARLQALQAADAAVREAYSGVVDEPLPERVLERVNAGPDQRDAGGRRNVATHPRAMWRRAPGAAPLAAAASIAFAAGVLVTFAVGGGSTGDPVAQLARAGAVADGSPLHAVLETQPSARSRALNGVEATPVLTFRTGDGGYCRRVELRGGAGGASALACRSDGSSWRIELVGFTSPAGAPADSERYVPASGAAGDPIDGAIDRLIEGDPLGRGAERELIDGGWSD